MKRNESYIQEHILQNDSLLYWSYSMVTSFSSSLRCICLWNADFRRANQIASFLFQKMHFKNARSEMSIFPPRLTSASPEHDNDQAYFISNTVDIVDRIFGMGISFSPKEIEYIQRGSRFRIQRCRRGRMGV